MRKKYLRIRAVAVAAITAVLGIMPTQLESQTLVTITFTHTGAMQSFTVPSACAPSMTIEALAASGGAGGTSGPAGANGGIVRAVMTNISGQVFYVYVGGQGSVTAGGFNGGGGGGVSSTSSGAGGGGASDVRMGANALANRILVAGAGGGGGGNSTYSPISGIGGAGSSFTAASGFGGGGAGGCASGLSGGEHGGLAGSYGSGGGGGGFLSGGEGGGQPSATTGGFGCNGTLGNGGAGGGTSYICGGATGGVNGGGGGGGGYYGGGGGMTGTGGCNGGGGGGSSWANNSLMSNITYTPGGNTGHGIVVVTYTYNGPALTASSTHTSLCTGTTATLQATGVNTYTWIGFSQTSSIAVTPSVLTSYTVQGTNSVNCTSGAVITITANPGVPVLSISSSTNEVCFGKSASLTATGAFTYSWTGGITNGVLFTPTVTTTYVVTGMNACGTSTAAATITVSPLAIAVLANPSLVCEGYPSILTAASSVTGYTWQPVALFGYSITVAPMATTIYTVSASDGTCSGTATLQVTTKTTPTITASATASSICQGNSVVLTAAGGATYSWSPGNMSGNSVTVSPASSTGYLVSGTNTLGCTSTANQVVLVNPSPTVNINASKTLACLGESINMLATGANNYSWTNGPSTPAYLVSPASTTIYTVTGLLSGNPCPGSKTISIGIVIPNVTAIANPSAVCFGGASTLIATGATTYTWNGIPGSNSQVVFPSANTTYSVATATQSGNLNCPATQTVQVVVNPNPTISVVATKSLICKAQSNTLTASGAVTYTWGAEGSGSVVVVKPNITTIYSVSGIDANGCENSQLITVVVSACSGLSENDPKTMELKIYPNPSNGEINIQSGSDIMLTLLNAVGQEIQVIKLDERNDHLVTLKDLAGGVYFLVGENALGWMNQKLIITR